MAYREVTMIEIKEVLRQRYLGAAKKRIAAQLRLDPKTVRRYVEVGEAHGLVASGGPEQLTDELLDAVIAELKKPVPHEHGEAWRLCERERSFIAAHLENRVRLTKIRKLLQRQGVVVPYPTLHRFATQQLGFGKKAATVPLADGKPGDELQIDPNCVGVYEPDGSGVRRRKIKVLVFSPNVSRYRFVYPIERETIEEVIAACEAAWAFYGGVFRTLIPDNLKAIVQSADPIEPRLCETFLEYAQARGFVIDVARVRRPQDKARVERAVRDVRDDCFGGERIHDLAAARDRAERWCRDEYGARRHTTTGRMPREHFLNLEAPALLPAPDKPYDVPQWCTPKVARDHFAQVELALYSLPTRLIGRTLRARVDRTNVRFYDRSTLIRICRRLPPPTAARMNGWRSSPTPSVPRRRSIASPPTPTTSSSRASRTAAARSPHSPARRKLDRAREREHDPARHAGRIRGGMVVRRPGSHAGENRHNVRFNGAASVIEAEDHVAGVPRRRDLHRFNGAASVIEAEGHDHE